MAVAAAWCVMRRVSRDVQEDFGEEEDDAESESGVRPPSAPLGVAARPRHEGWVLIDGTLVGHGTLPLVGPTPSTADVGEQREQPEAYDLSTGLGDGLSRGQRAAVLAAFRQSE